MKKYLSITAGMIAVLAQGAFAAEGAPAANPLASFMPLIVIFAIFYFLIIRPQQKKAKEHQNMLSALKKDDRIITSGGLYATVISVKGDTIEAKIAENVKVQIARSFVSAVVTQESPKTEAVTPEIIK